MRRILPSCLLGLALLPIAAQADTLTATLTGDGHTFVFTLQSPYDFPNQLHLVTIPTIRNTGSTDGTGGQTFDVTFFSGIADPGSSFNFDNLFTTYNYTFFGNILVHPGTDPNAPAGDLTAIFDTGKTTVYTVNPKGAPDYFTLDIEDASSTSTSDSAAPTPNPPLWYSSPRALSVSSASLANEGARRR
jgi:hypothetical protein